MLLQYKFSLSVIYPYEGFVSANSYSKILLACIVQTLQYVRIQLVERKFVDFVVIHFFLLLLSLFAADQGSSAGLCLFVITPLKMILFAAVPFESLCSDNRNARPRFAVGRCIVLFTCILLRRLEKIFFDIKNATSFTDVFPYK